MIQWIRECVSTPSFTICVNRIDHGYFKGERGFRQGDPLPPYIFMMVMEVFNLIILMNIHIMEGFRFHSRRKDLRITHLCCADELLVFPYGNGRLARVIMETFDEFRLFSGLVANFNKSQIFFGRVSPRMKGIILIILTFNNGKMPIRYLGVPLSVTKLFIRD